MKRFVYIPVDMAQDGVPELAEEMSKNSQLAIRIGEKNDGITASEIGIISTPEIFIVDNKPSVHSGFIYSIDITNEFVNFDTSTTLEVFDEGTLKIFKPRLREKHLVRFRIRVFTPGDKVFFIRSALGVQYHEGFFEVL